MKGDLLNFAINTLADIDQDTDYEHSWHIDLICDTLERMYDGEFNRLIINIPPRSLKSICVSVAFPAWILAQKPAAKIITVSYSKALSLKHATDCRRIIQSDWYKSITKTRLLKNENQKSKFITPENGYRFSTSVNGTLTGEGGDFIVVDDPHNPVNIESAKARKNVISWFESVLMSRLNNKKTGKVLLVMQRLHLDDLTGYLIKKPKSPWKLLSIPQIENVKREYEFCGKKYRYSYPGLILNSERNAEDVVENIKKDLGERNFQAQYQQSPLTKSGLVKKIWFPEYNKIPQDAIHYLSIDAALNQGIKNDYTVIMHISVHENLFYIQNVIREKISYPDLKMKIQSIIKDSKIHSIIIEDKALGSPLIQELGKISNTNIIKFIPKHSKEVRLCKILDTIESGKVLLPQIAEWKDAFVNEITCFPNSQHDDQVDAISQFLNWHISKNITIDSQIRLRLL